MISLLGMPALQYEENDSYLTVLADLFSFVICNSTIYVTSCKYIVEREWYMRRSSMFQAGCLLCLPMNKCLLF